MGAVLSGSLVTLPVSCKLRDGSLVAQPARTSYQKRGFGVVRKQTDFQKIVQDLKDWGWGYTELARDTGVAKTKFAKLRSGLHAQPTYDDGVTIIDFYKKVTKAQITAKAK